MPYRSYEIRVRKYELGVIPDNVRAKFEALKPLMLDGQERAQAEIVDIETAVRALLDDNGIMANVRVMYLNFARALYRAKGHNSGLALRKIATAEKAKFVQYGLDPDILDAIIQIVIGTTAY